MPRAWLGRLSTYLVSFAWGMAVYGLTGRLGYRWLAGAVALMGVVTAAAWIRGLGARARVARYAPPLLLVPAACAAVIAVLGWGTAVGISTAAAAALSISAVLAAKELRFAATLLLGAPFIALGAPFIETGAALIATRYVLAGAGAIAAGLALVAVGTALLVMGAAFLADPAMVAGAAVITLGATLTAILRGVHHIRDRAPSSAATCHPPWRRGVSAPPFR